ncbi:MAG: AMP-binding protein, partial [Acidimicrobiia bacterium]|nr:AMP-binding protein [Acidimicrobiia bacterium]
MSTERPAPLMDPDMNWVAVLEHHARRTPDRPVAVCGDEVVTYRQMVDRAAAMAAGLAERGIVQGDVVGLLSYNNVEFMITLFAANHLGAIAMPVNWRLAPAEVRYILDHSGARVLVCHRDLLGVGVEATVDWAHDRVRVCIGDEAPSGWEAFASMCGSMIPPRVSSSGDDIHRLMYTSGTTGHPKGVMITHANLAWKNFAHVTEFGFTSDDVGLACGPLYHVGALDLVTTSMLAVGATTVIHRVFDAEQVVDEIERSGVTVVWAAPAMLRAILELAGVDNRDLSSVRVIIAGGEKLPVPFVE